MGFEEIEAGKMKAIDSNALFKLLASISTTGSVGFCRGAYVVAEKVLEFVKNSPTVDTVKHGKWVSDMTGVVKCSACKHQAYFLRGYELFDYCPYCGAKMDGNNNA